MTENNEPNMNAFYGAGCFGVIGILLITGIMLYLGLATPVALLLGLGGGGVVFLWAFAEAVNA